MLSFSAERRAQKGKVRLQSESLSPPPPRPLHGGGGSDNRQGADNRQAHVMCQPEDVTDMSQLRRAGNLSSIISAAEAVASALELSPAIRKRVEAEEAEEQRKVVERCEEAEERWGGQTFQDLGTIAESPSEAVPEMTPEVEGKGVQDKLTNLRDKMTPEVAGSGLPFDNEFESGMLRCLSTTTMSTQTGLHSSSPSSPIKKWRASPRIKWQAAPRPLQKGSPVSFYLDGCPTPYVGWLKGMTGNGLYTVDLVGGGRMTGLEMVTPCSIQETKKAEQLRQKWHFSEDPYSEFDVPSQTNQPPQDDRSFLPGAAVSFSLEKHELSHKITVDYPERLHGRVQKVCDDGTYVIELAGGGRRCGIRHLAPATEVDLEKVCHLKNGWKTNKMDSLDTSSTRNSPAWGGGCGFSGGYRERSPPAHIRSLGGSMSCSSLPPSLLSSSSCIGRKGLRSKSPNPCRRAADDSGLWQVGTPVSFFLEGELDAAVGWIHAVDADGKFTVETVGGRRVVGLTQVMACDETGIDRARKLKSAMVTRKDPLSELGTRNGPAARSPSPMPRLRGVAINLPPTAASRRGDMQVASPRQRSFLQLGRPPLSRSPSPIPRLSMASS